ncbi:SDR family NAD(P)-dependent oxidoreductase [Conexibacter sp. W3-3-2]|nr:SDR family NAD(P)-dependent oxidoreductase [Conexibacter sp. W3-3-2]
MDRHSGEGAPAHYRPTFRTIASRRPAHGLAGPRAGERRPVATSPAPYDRPVRHRPLPSPPLSGQVLLVSGAAGGIGAATARALAARGVLLALTDRDEAAVRALAAELPGASAHVLDVTDRSACIDVVAAVTAAHGRLDAVWANAGISVYGPLDLVDADTWDAVLDVNLRGAANLVRAALPAVMQARGYVALTCSVASFVHQPGHTAYAASKAGLEALGDSLRSELTGTGVRVGTFHPGWIATSLVAEKEDHQPAFRRFREAVRPPFNTIHPVDAIVPEIVGAFEHRRARLVFPRVHWLAHALRPVAHTRALSAGVRAAAPEIRRLYAEQLQARQR